MTQPNPQDQAQALRDAARAHTDLHIFAMIQDLCEGSFVSSKSLSAAWKIISVCRSQRLICCDRYDRHERALTSPAPETTDAE